MSTASTTPPVRRRGRPPANRDKLLAAALECLRTKGYAGTTSRDLVEASGTNLASIGYHFGSKQALLNEAIGVAMAAWTASIEHEVMTASSARPHERLHLALASMLDRFDELAPYLLAFVEAFPPAVRSPELQATMADAYRRARDAGRAMILRTLEEQGIENQHKEADVLASLILAIGDGMILQYLLAPGSTPSSDEVVAALRAVIPAIDAS